MKFPAFVLPAALSAVMCSVLADVRQGENTISRVVKLLQEIMDQTKADGEAERELFAKHKCYCDANKASKKTSIESLTKQISMLENEIGGLLSRNGALSLQSNQLEKDLAGNVKARADADSIRVNQQTAFNTTEADLTQSISQLEQAIEELASVGADQTIAVGADHTQYMKNTSALISLQNTVKEALVAASAVATTKQSRRVAAFLQKAPFTSTYTSQAGEVVGILKDMKVTFESNLAAARAEEAAAVAAYNKFISVKEEEHQVLVESQTGVQEELGQNDGSLSSKRIQLNAAQDSKSDDEAFLTSLVDMCAEKAKQYAQRTEMRRNEETALAQAIAILNSDAAFETFRASRNSLSLLQRKSIRLHKQKEEQKENAETILRRGGSRSPRLMKIAAMLQTNNPFAVVLAEIKKVLSVIAEEEKADMQQFSWCESERQTNGKNLGDRHTDITNLNTDIAQLNTDINHPETGLKVQLTNTENLLSVNQDNQRSETTDRKSGTAQYKKELQDMVEAQRLITSAISVLSKYYAKILKDAEEPPTFLQDGPAPPATWDSAYHGNQKGKDAIGMLEYILETTQAEEASAHSTEQSAQDAYEASMAKLKQEETSLQTTFAYLREELADKEELLLRQKSDLKVTEQEKLAIENYLEKIKPGCDFIVSQKSARDKNREEEKAALEEATKLLENSPAYLTAVAAQHNETLGGCLSSCSSEETAVCKACLARVTVPAYCAGHPQTAGC